MYIGTPRMSGAPMCNLYREKRSRQADGMGVRVRSVPVQPPDETALRKPLSTSEKDKGNYAIKKAVTDINTKQKSTKALSGMNTKPDIVLVIYRHKDKGVASIFTNY